MYIHIYIYMEDLYASSNAWVSFWQRATSDMFTSVSADTNLMYG